MKKMHKIQWKKRIAALFLAAAVSLSQPTMRNYAAENTADDSITAIQPSNPVHDCTGEDGGSDKTAWSYVYFGSYPQSEVTDEGIISAIDAALTIQGKGKGDVWVDGTKYRKVDSSDTNQTKYFGDNPYRYFKWERIRWKVLSNDGSKLFLLADQALDCNEYNESLTATTWENCTIRSWLNGYGGESNIDGIDYTADSFFQNAFSVSEQGEILTTTVVNGENPDYHTDGGNDTSDKLFLLSYDEATNEAYGFCSKFTVVGSAKNTVKSASRWIQPTTYARAMGTNASDNGNAWWSFRTPGDYRDRAQATGSNYLGAASSYGGEVNYHFGGVVPALYLSLSSELLYAADDGTSGAGGSVLETTSVSLDVTSKTLMAGDTLQLHATVLPENATNKNVIWESSDTTVASVDATGKVTAINAGTATIKAIVQKNNLESTCQITVEGSAITDPEVTEPDPEIEEAEEEGTPNTAVPPSNPIHHCTGESGGSDYTEWGYVFFGSYPQSEVTDAGTISAIDAALLTLGQTKGDVEVDGTRYRKVGKSDANQTNNFGDNEYRYFKWEPIKWKVLSSDDSKLFLLADQALDCNEFNESYKSVTWETSTIRSWLNGYGSKSNEDGISYTSDSFYRDAFTALERGAILTTTVVNEDNSAYQTEGGNDTSDKIFLLSLSDAMNEDYGFCPKMQEGSNARNTVESSSRWVEATAYAKAMGANPISHDTLTAGNANVWWSLRTPGYNLYNYFEITGVNAYGAASSYGTDVDNGFGGVVPAMYIKRISNLWYAENSGTTEPGTTEPGTTEPETTHPGITGIEQNNTNAGGGVSAGQTSEDVKVTALSITGISKKIAAGKKIQLKAVVAPSNATNPAVTWTSSNTKYATVTSKGKVTMKKAGIGKMVTITATATDGSGKKAIYKIKIMKHAVKKVKITAGKRTVQAGKTLKLKATVTTTGKSANKTLKWTSSNTKYATVSKSGKVKAKRAGKGKKVTITAMATDGSGKKAKVKIKIK